MVDSLTMRVGGRRNISTLLNRGFPSNVRGCETTPMAYDGDVSGLLSRQGTLEGDRVPQRAGEGPEGTAREG